MFKPIKPKYKLLAAIMTTMIASNLYANPFSQSGNKAIYGKDDRIDVYEANSKGKKLSSSIVALVKTSNLQQKSSGYRLATNNYGESMSLCSSVRFYQQPTSAFCSGVVIGSKYILTAGHCKAVSCDQTAIVLDFDMTSSSSARQNFSSKQVYRCQSVVAKGESSNSDWMIMAMDRDFEQNLAVKPSSKTTAGQADNKSFTIIGHPSGLPKKLAANGQYLLKESPHIFRTSLDSYQGNSGSPVFNTQSILRGTPELEGVLVNGNTDFIVKNGCRVENYCSADSTSRECQNRGEGVTDIRFIIEALGYQAEDYFSQLSIDEPEQEASQQAANDDYTQSNVAGDSPEEQNDDFGTEAQDLDENEAQQMFSF